MKNFKEIDMLWKSVYEENAGIIIFIEGKYHYIFELLIDSGFKRCDILAYYYKNLLEYQFSKNYSAFKKLCKNFDFVEICKTHYDEYERLRNENWMLSQMQSEFNIMLIDMEIDKEKLPIKLYYLFVSAHDSKKD